jgi:hypothetical protein
LWSLQAWCLRETSSKHCCQSWWWWGKSVIKKGTASHRQKVLPCPNTVCGW